MNEFRPHGHSLVIVLSGNRTRIWILGLAVLLAQGCSGPCSMVLHNDTDETARVTYAFLDPSDHEKRTADVILRPGGAAEESLWFESAPEWLDIDARFGIWRVKERILKRDFPANVLAESSAATSFHVHVTRKELAVNGPTFWDRYGALALWGSAATVVALIAARVTKAKP